MNAESVASVEPTISRTPDEPSVSLAARLSPHRSDIITIVLLGLLVVVTRWPFQTQYLFSWDAANFALGMRDFDVAIHQPHPPGYAYVVLLGVLLQAIFRDANTALVIQSILFEVISVGAIYLFGKTLFSVRAGIVAGLLLAASVTFWSHGEIALSYPSLAAFSTLTAYFAYQTAFLGRDRLLWCAGSYVIATGFRPDLAIFLLPLVAIACRHQPPRRILVAAGIAVGGVLLWVIPTALLSGGLGNYWAAVTTYFTDDVVDRYAPTALGHEGLYVNVRDTAAYLFYALYAEALIVVSGGLLLLWSLKRHAREDTLRQCLFLLAWASPMLLFYLFLHIGNPGYIFSVLPAVLLLAVMGWYERLRNADEQTSVLAGCGLALVLMANAFIFFLHDRPLTLQGLQRNDRSIAAKVSYIASLNPAEVMVFTYDSYKQLEYYLPNVQNNIWLDTADHLPLQARVPDGVKWALFMDPSVFFLVQGLRAEAEVLADDSFAARLPVRTGQTITYTGSRIEVSP